MSRSKKRRRITPSSTQKKLNSNLNPLGHNDQTSSVAESSLILKSPDEQLNTYDETLLERARTQWQFGDWESLAKLDRETLQHHPDRAKLALLAAAGRLQSDKNEEARQYIRLAQDWGISKKLVSQILIAGVHNSLGRAHAVQGNERSAMYHFESSIRVGQPSSAADLLVTSRARTQLEQAHVPLMTARLGLPVNRASLSFAHTMSRDSVHRNAHWQSHIELLQQAEMLQQADRPQEAQSLLLKALHQAPKSKEILAAVADNAMRCGEYTDAARYWQDLIAELGPDTPQSVYEQLSDAYDKSPGFGGTPEENHCWGDRHKHEILAELHQQLQPRLYLEIGVDEGIGLALAKGPAIGIDPRAKLKLRVTLPETSRIITASSDSFFRDQATSELTEYLDLVFIDGMHLFEFALRDFINVERFSHPATLVVIDDIHPCHPTQAERRRKSGSWTGDVWKIHRILKKYRPDLRMLDLNANTTGLLLIAGLDAQNETLSTRYEEIIEKYREELPPPTVLVRTGVAPSDTPVLAQWLEVLRRARDEAWGRDEVVKGLTVN
jgi:tetratricopeptide (TPR) repeat protein